jgi:hypothetical protein
MKILFTLIGLLFSISLFAGTITAVTTASSPGDWNSTNTWSEGNIPQSGDKVIIPTGKAVVVQGQIYGSQTPTLFIEVSGTLNFEPSGKLNLSLLSNIQLLIGGKIAPKNGSSSQLITIGGITKYNAANNGTLTGPAFADALSGASVAGQLYSGFNPGVLPVKFISFTAKRISGGALLQWQTAEEQNAEKFSVERSEDGGNSWVQVGEVAARGTAALYSFTNYYTKEETYQYRVKTVDKDQHFAYSTVVQVVKGTAVNLSVAPNPTSGSITIAISKLLTEKESFRLFNTSGQLVKNIPSNSRQGVYTLDLVELPKGAYILALVRENQLIEKQTILLH